MAKKNTQQRKSPSFSSAARQEYEEEGGGMPSSSFDSYNVTKEEEGDADGEENPDGGGGTSRGTPPPDSVSYTGPSQAPTLYSAATIANPPPSNYVAVAPLPTFRGLPGECPVEHLSRFYRACRANNATTADMAARIFPVTLADEAARWYELAVEPDDSSVWVGWGETKSMFLEAYRRPEQYRSELMSLKQREEESVWSYHLRMQWILKKWPEHGISDEILGVMFVDGLRWEECQEWVVLQRPNSVSEAFQHAQSWERAESIRLVRRRKEGSLRCGFCGGGEHEEGDCESRRKMKELWRTTTKGGGGVEVGVAGTEGDGKAAAGDDAPKRSQCLCWKHQCWKKLDRSVTAPATRAPPPSSPSPPLLR